MAIGAELLTGALAGIAFVGCSLTRARPAHAAQGSGATGAAARGRRQRQAGQDRRCPCPHHRSRGGGGDQPSARGAGAVVVERVRPHRRDGRRGGRRRGAQHQPLLVSRRARRGGRADQDPERKARRILRRHPRPLCRLCDRRIAASAARRRAARIRDQDLGAARPVGRRQRRRSGTGRPEIPPGLGQGRGARHPDLHAPARHPGIGAERPAQGQRPFDQHDRQPARNHDRTCRI